MADEARQLSPLHEIETIVLDRARSLALDDTDTEALRRLVGEAIEEWSVDHRRGTRPHPLANPELLGQRALRNLTGYGPLEPLLADDDVWEVMINAPHGVWARSASGAAS